MRVGRPWRLGLQLLTIATAGGRVDGRTVVYAKVADTETPIAFTDPLNDFSPPSIRGGHVAFMGGAIPNQAAQTTRQVEMAGAPKGSVGAGGDFYFAVLHSNAIYFTKMADTDTAIPGGGGGDFTTLGAPSFDELFGVFNGDGGGGESGIYLGCCGPAPSAVAAGGDLVPGGSATYLAFFPPVIDRDPVDEVNWIAFQALTMPGFQQGLYLLGPQPQVVADFSTPIPGRAELFTGFSNPDLDERIIAFRGSGDSGHSGVYKRGVTDVDLAVVADVNTDIPGGNGTFTGFGASSSFGVLSTRNGDVAFRGDGAALQKGIYAEIDGVLGVVVDLNTPPPPEASGAFFDFPDVAPSISDGNVAFVTTDDLFQSSVYVKFDGELLRIARPGDVLDGRTVNGAVIGPEALDGNLLAFLVFFDDGSRAVYVAIIGEEPPPTDINGDGEVGGTDLLLVLDGWGSCADCDDCPADVDGDCEVGMIDLLFVLATWGPLDTGPPTNDECLGATTVTGGAYAFSTIGATTSDVILPSGNELGLPTQVDLDCDEGAGYSFENDIWFRYIVPDRDGIITVLTCGLTDFDSRLALYRRVPGNAFVCSLLEGVTCNDDAPFCEFGSIASVQIAPELDLVLPLYAVEPGDELMIRVGSKEPATSGSGILAVTVVPGPQLYSVPFGDEPHSCQPIGGTKGHDFIIMAGTKGGDFGSNTGSQDDTPNCGDLDVKDQWRCFISPWTGVVRLSAFSFTHQLLSIAAYDAYGTMLACSAIDETTASTVIHWGVVVGQRYLIRFGTLDGDAPAFGGRLKLVDDDACGWPFAGPCFIDNPGIPGCDEGSCCTLVCGLDPYCCHIEWDGLCATQANMLCDPDPGPACPNTGFQSCYQAGIGPGCSDPDCCEAVCQIDAFCCDFEWDLECAQLAVVTCDPPPCGTSTSQSCCEPSDVPGCHDSTCCGVVCEVLPFCCDSEWNEQCADAAAALCPICQ